ncbi:glycosyltransferase family 4 protein [Candidatus Sumerlaeota bacterium]|nr:glycosyltransferase family 4 protein [Candidatus Sumerlaeota bacterium]
MRIAHLTTVHTWRDVRIFRKMCRFLARDGHEVHLVAPREGEARTETIDGVVLHSVPKPRTRLERALKTVRHAMSEAERTRADLFHFHDPELLAPMAVLRRRSGKPVVYDVHEDYRSQILAKPWLPRGTRRFVSWRFGRQEDWLAGRMTAIVCATPHIARRFASHPRCAIVQNFPDLAEFADDESLSPEPDAGRFVYVGWITAIRGLREIVEALPIAGESVRLTLGGEWNCERFRKELRARAEWSRVDELGYLDRPAVRRELARAQAGLVLFHPLPNHIEAQPTKLFEYMAAGIPVIASDFPLWRSIVEEAECGLLADPEDPTDIARAMRWVVDRPAEAREMGRRGRLAVQARYNWASEYTHLADLYRRIAAS